jgi:cathepsin B
MLSFLVVLAATPGLAQNPNGKSQINDPAWIKLLNEIENSTWTAGQNDVFNEMSFDEARVLMGTDLLHISDYLQSGGKTLDDSYYAGMDDPPASFDARTQWQGLIHPIRDQQRCGSCWAFSASEVLSDRVAIATKKASPVLSPEDMVSCDTGDMGCQGGMLPKAWDYLQETGIVSDKCFPYGAGNGKAPTCSKQCADSETWASSKVKAKSSYAINGVPNMQKEIMTNGPIQVAFKVYKSFMSYKTGVYSKHFWELLPEGGHAVKIVGWGTEKNVDYWLVANSWNTSWGEEGFFKIKRGSNQCGIETMGPPYAGMPATDELFVI